MSFKALFTRRRLTRIGTFASAQVVVQAVAFASGLILVRYMEVAEYGYYTLAISMIGLSNVLLDLGLAGAVIAGGGPLHSEPRRLAGLVADANAASTRLLLFGAPVLTVCFLAMFLKLDSEFLNSAALALLVVSAACLNVRSTILLSIIRIQGNLQIQQRLDLGVNIGRLLIVLMLVLVYLNAAVAIAVNLITAAVMWTLLMRHVASSVGKVGTCTHEHDEHLYKFVKRQAPNSVYFCFVGQITVWLIGLFGSTERVAELGALGRLAAAFTVLGVVLAAVVQPYFARGLAKRDWVSGFIVVNCIFSALSVFFVSIAVWSPNSVLWILGSKYSSLDDAVVWMVLSSCLSSWSGALYSLGAAKGWLIPFWVVVPVGLGTVVFAALSVDTSTVIGCLIINTAVAGAGLAMTFGMVTRKLLRWPNAILEIR